MAPAKGPVTYRAGDVPPAGAGAGVAEGAAVSELKTSPKAELIFLSVNFDLKAPVVFCGRKKKGEEVPFRVRRLWACRKGGNRGLELSHTILAGDKDVFR